MTDKENLWFYRQLEQPSADALNAISGGKLKGKTDINPQWKIEKMTEVFGPCGVGWRAELVDVKFQTMSNGEVLVFMQAALYIRVDGDWSAPVYGFGGDFAMCLEKGQLVCNDEATKMCWTDALGNAMKHLGVAANVWRKAGKNNGSKYSRPQQAQQPVQPAAPYQQPRVSFDGGVCRILDGSGKMRQLIELKDEALKWALNSQLYAEAHVAIKTEMARRAGSDGCDNNTEKAK